MGALEGRANPGPPMERRTAGPQVGLRRREPSCCGRESWLDGSGDLLPLKRGQEGTVAEQQTPPGHPSRPLIRAPLSRDDEGSDFSFLTHTGEEVRGLPGMNHEICPLPGSTQVTRGQAEPQVLPVQAEGHCPRAPHGEPPTLPTRLRTQRPPCPPRSREM